MTKQKPNFPMDTGNAKTKSSTGYKKPSYKDNTNRPTRGPAATKAQVMYRGGGK